MPRAKADIWEILRHYNVDPYNAYVWIRQNLDKPKLLFDTFVKYNISANNLSQLTGFSIESIYNYFKKHGLDADKLPNWGYDLTIMKPYEFNEYKAIHDDEPDNNYNYYLGSIGYSQGDYSYFWNPGTLEIGRLGRIVQKHYNFNVLEGDNTDNIYIVAPPRLDNNIWHHDIKLTIHNTDPFLTQPVRLPSDFAGAALMFQYYIIDGPYHDPFGGGPASAVSLDYVNILGDIGLTTQVATGNYAIRDDLQGRVIDQGTYINLVLNPEVFGLEAIELTRLLKSAAGGFFTEFDPLELNLTLSSGQTLAFSTSYFWVGYTEDYREDVQFPTTYNMELVLVGSRFEEEFVPL